MKIFSWVSDLFLKVFRALKPIFLAVFDAAFQILLAKLKEVATSSIKKLAASDLSSEQKRSAAFKEIKAYAIAQCLTVNDSDIYLAIEIFHKALKKQGVIA